MKSSFLGWLLLAAVMLVGPTSPATAGQPNWPDTLTIATASPGGTYHAYGLGLAKILSDALKLPVAERVTEGPTQNIQLLESGEVQIAFVTVGAALQGWNGTGDWTNGKEFRQMRAAFPMYATPFQFIVRRSSDVQSIHQLLDKRIGIGPKGGTAGTYVPKLMTTLNVAADYAYGSWDEMAAQLEDGSIDAIVAAVGAPFPTIASLEKTKAIRFIPLTAEDNVAVRLALPELTAVSIAPGTYPSLMQAYPTVGLYNFAVVSESLPTDLVYKIVQAVFDHHEELIAAHPAAVATIPDNFVYNTFLPYHPGASRYYASQMVPGSVQRD